MNPVRVSTLNQHGQSIVQVLVSVAIMGILMMAMVSMQSLQAKENRALAEKLAALDFQRTLSAAFIDGTVCLYVLNNPSVLTFDSTAVTATTPQTITVTSPLYASIVGGVPGPILAKTNPPTPISPISNTLVVNSIALSIKSGTGNSYIGNWVVGFDGSKLVRAIKPATSSVILTVDLTMPKAAKITACQNGAAGGASAPTIQVVSTNDPTDKSCTATCPSGTKLTGGGCNADLTSPLQKSAPGAGQSWTCSTNPFITFGGYSGGLTCYAYCT